MLEILFRVSIAGKSFNSRRIYLGDLWSTRFVGWLVYGVVRGPDRKWEHSSRYCVRRESQQALANSSLDFMNSAHLR